MTVNVLKFQTLIAKRNDKLANVNSEIFTRNLFLRKALKDIFATFKIRDLDMIDLHQ